MSSKKQAQDDDDDFYDDSGILDMIPEPDDGVEQDASSEEGVDEDFLNELGKAKATPFKRPLKYFVFLLKGKAQKGVRIINLPHPKTGISAKYVLNSDKKLLEVQRTSGLNSWFLNDKSIEDGSLFLTSEIDPLFLLLPIVDKARKAKVGNSGVFLQESGLLEELDKSTANFLRAHVPLLKLICDVKSQGTDTFYRLNDDKVVTWLHHKVDALCTQLEQIPDVSTLVRAQASGFRARGQVLTTLELLKLAIGFVGDYVEKKWIALLETKIGISAAEVQAAAARKAYASEEEVAPRKRSAPTNGFDDALAKEVATPAPKKKMNLAQARLAKVDIRGMSPITSFFQKKS